MKAFENLKYRQIKALLDVVNSTKIKNFEVITKRYKSVSENFNCVKQFLLEIKVLNEQYGIVTIKKEFQVTLNRQLNDNTLKGLLLDELLTTKSVLSQDINNYLDKFEVVKDSFEYKPNTVTRVKESGVRNLFIELDLIEYNRSSGTYRIKERHSDSFQAYMNRKKLSPKELSVILKRKDELGMAAELEVLRYEKERLAKYPELIAKIEHIAKKDVLAGYDILSWSLEHNRGSAVPIYIEVKAISKNDNIFYWTRNEIEKAKKLADRYYLYLLPVIGNKRFDVRDLEIILDPVNEVFNNSSLWNRQVETYLFSKKT